MPKSLAKNEERKYAHIEESMSGGDYSSGCARRKGGVGRDKTSRAAS